MATSNVEKILVKSADRITGTPSDFVIAIPQLHNVSKVSLVSASIPNTIYNIIAGSNTFSFTVGATTATGSIVPGAYSIASLTATLKTAFDAAAVSAGLSGLTFNFVYSPATMKVTVFATGSAFFINESPLLEVIGFDTPSATVNTEHYADRIIRLDFPGYLIINVRELHESGIITSSGDRGSFIVQSNGNSGYLLSFNENSGYPNHTTLNYSGSLSTLHINLYDPFKREIPDLNGGDWSMILAIEYFC